MRRIVSLLTEFRRGLPKENVKDREQIESDIHYWKRRIARKEAHLEAGDEVPVSSDDNQMILEKPKKGKKS